MKKTNAEDLIAHGVHFGHKSQKVHPKSKRFIYKIDNGVSIIDLYKTAVKLDEAKEFLFNLGKEGKSLLVVATKKQARPIVREICDKNGIFYMTNKWPGGFVTNFTEIHKNIKLISDMKKAKEEGAWNQFPKHEIVKLDKKLIKLLKIYEGVASITKLHDAFFVIDMKKENNSIVEANMKKIPVVAIADTNINPEIVNYPVPGNDDALASINFLTQEILGAYVEGKEKMEKVEKVESPKVEKVETAEKVN